MKYSNFDYNISNYTKTELEELLGLKQPYGEQDILKNISKMRRSINNDINLSDYTRKQMIDFLIDAKTKLKEAGDTYIIEKEQTPYIYSYPSEFYSGKLNPLNKRIIRQNVNIDTRFRDNYYTTTSTNFHLDLPLKLTKVVSLSLSSIELPKAIYNISASQGNNYFWINIPTTGAKTNIVVPDGIYNDNTLQNTLNFIMSTQTDADLKTITFYIDLSNNSGTGKMFVGSTSGTLIFSLDFITDKDGMSDNQTPLPLKFGWYIGFRSGYYENTTMYISEGIVDVGGCRYMYLVVDDFNNNVNDGFYAAFNSSFMNKNILARIALNANNVLTNTLTSPHINNTNYYTLVTSNREYFGPVNIQQIQVQLLDEYGRIIDLNYMDYSFCLTFQTIYDL